MIWHNPAALAFLAFIPVIILLHSLRRRRRQVQVSTLFLWESVAREFQGSLGIQRLVRNLPLLLQILLVLLLTAALVNPVLTRAVPSQKDVVLVLDVSASMQTQTSQGSRFSQAQKLAMQILDSFPGDRLMALIAAGRHPKVLSFFTHQHDFIRQTIADLRPGDAPGDMHEAVLLALTFARDSQTQEVVVIGDGAYRRAEDFGLSYHRVRHIQVAGGETNVGITRMAFRKRLNGDEEYELFLAVQNFSQKQVEVPLRVTMGKRLLLEQQLLLQPLEEKVVLSTVRGDSQGIALAETLLDDDLILDNHAYGVLEAKRQTRVLLVGERNYFLEQVLRSIPGVGVGTIPELHGEVSAQLLESNNLIIFNNVQPPSLSRGNFLLINTAPRDERLQNNGMVVHPRITDWDREHPLLHSVELTDVQIEEALALLPQGQARSLVEADGTSLLSIIEEPRLRLLTLAFDLMRSDFPLRVAFPVFIGNLLRWINLQYGDVVLGQVQAGQPFPLYFDSPVERVTVKNPEGRTIEYKVQGNPLVFSDTDKVGVYLFQTGGEKRYLVVSLLDEMESDINSGDRLPSVSPVAEEGRSEPTGTAETALWPYFLLAGVAVLLGEWCVWCRDF